MENRTVEELIEELQELRIREIEIIAELKQANSAGTRTQTGDANSHRHEVAHGFRRGDRVRVINKVRKPATAGPSWNEAKERLATVTRIIPDQVHILTDNGTKTWRVPNNLQQMHSTK